MQLISAQADQKEKKLRKECNKGVETCIEKTEQKEDKLEKKMSKEIDKIKGKCADDTCTIQTRSNREITKSKEICKEDAAKIKQRYCVRLQEVQNLYSSCEQPPDDEDQIGFEPLQSTVIDEMRKICYDEINYIRGGLDEEEANSKLRGLKKAKNILFKADVEAGDIITESDQKIAKAKDRARLKLEKAQCEILHLQKAQFESGWSVKLCCFT